MTDRFNYLIVALEKDIREKGKAHVCILFMRNR